MRFIRSLLRLFFRYFYTTLAWSYDLVASVVSVGQWKEWVYSAMDPPPDRPILELAHGPGHLLLKLSEQYSQAVGIDFSRQMCRIASRRLRRAGMSPRVVQARAQDLPFAGGSFATLISTFPTEFILDQASLAEAYRTLKPEGQFRVVPMAEIRGASSIDRLAAWLFRLTGQYADLPPSWTEPISDAGFRVHRDDVELVRSRVVRLVGVRSKSLEGQVV